MPRIWWAAVTFAPLRRNCGEKSREEIGAEVHRLDQFFRVEEGSGEAVLDGVRTAVRVGFAVVVPAGTNHNIINTAVFH